MNVNETITGGEMPRDEAAGGKLTPRQERAESALHRACKLEIYEALSGHPDVGRIMLERPLGELRPDISFNLRNAHKVAVEVQLSRLPPHKIARRTCLYAERNIHVLWCSPMAVTGPPRGHLFAPAAWQRYVHSLYGCFFFWEHGQTLTPVRFDAHYLYRPAAEVWRYGSWLSCGGYHHLSRRYSRPVLGVQAEIADLVPAVCGGSATGQCASPDARIMTRRGGFQPVEASA